MIRVFAPATSSRGKKLRQAITRFRHHRAINYNNARYNSQRQNYYTHAKTFQGLPNDPKVSIVVPCFNTPQKYFEPLLDSIFAQGYSSWELVLIDASTNQQSNDYLYQKSQADTRIEYLKTENKGIAANTNIGISAATGDYIAFLDHDDTLDHNALFEVMALFKHNSKLGLVYTDEDKISDNGERFLKPHFKPDFSPDLLRNVNYITHFVVARKSLIEKVGGIRSGFEGAQDFDFLLRIIDTGAELGHVPKVLYHWREADGSTASNFSNKKYVTDAGKKALDEHFKRQNITNVKAHIIKNRPGFYDAVYSLESTKYRIYVDLEGYGLLDQEKDFIINCYRNNDDVKAYDMDVISGSSKEPGALIVKGPFIPANKRTQIAGLFGLASEKGVYGVSPKIVRNGRIYDMGIVHVDGEKKALFKGVNPNQDIGFGSIEWVRNVDELTSNVTIHSKHQTGRCIVWAHTEFIAFIPPSPRLISGLNYYNPNILELTELSETVEDYVSDLIRVEK